MSISEFITQLLQAQLEGYAISPTHIELESQNEEYYGSRFTLNKHSVRFRKGKLTPTKAGFFVVAWEKDQANKNQAYAYDTAPDFLMVYCASENATGLFVFPKDILLKHGILSSADLKGKMGFRVYPPWETTLNKQATASQKWQGSCFFDLGDARARKALSETFYNVQDL